MKKNIFEIECDITDEIKFKKICSEIVRKKKRIDVLINVNQDMREMRILNVKRTKSKNVFKKRKK